MGWKLLHVGMLVLFFLTARSQKEVTVAGSVTDKNMNPVAGASVYLLNTNLATFSDKAGKFRLSRIVAGKYTVQVTAVGYASLRKPLVFTENNEQLTLQINEAASQLDEVVVTAQKKEESLVLVPLCKANWT